MQSCRASRRGPRSAIIRIRFNSKVHTAHYAKPVSEVGRWAPILADVEKVLKGNSYNTVDVGESDEIYQKVVELVPWSWRPPPGRS